MVDHSFASAGASFRPAGVCAARPEDGVVTERSSAVEHNAVLMRIYVSESRRHGGAPTFHRLLEALRDAGFRGATAFRGIGGFGYHRRISADRALDAPGDFPVLIEVADDVDRVRRFLPLLESVLDDGLVTLERVQRLVSRAEPA